MYRLISLEGKQYLVESDSYITHQQAAAEAQKAAVCGSCGSRGRMSSLGTGEGIILHLGTANCPSTINQGTAKQLSVSVTQGTQPFTYSWVITKPGGGTDTLPNSPGPHSYNFSIAGNYTVSVTVSDSCPNGALSDTASCTITVQPVSTTGSIVCTSTPSAANIYLDGVNTGQATPATLTNVPAGGHIVSFVKSGYQQCDVAINVTAGGTVNAGCTLTPASTTGSIVCTTTPPGADVWVDGINQNTVTPVTFTNVPAGAHTVVFKLSGYNDCTVQVTVTAGASVPASCTLTPSTNAGSLSVTSVPAGASIYVDEVYGGITPMTIPLTAGIHVLRLSLQGYNDFTESVTITAGQTTSVTATLTTVTVKAPEPKESMLPVLLAFTALGVTVLGLVLQQRRK